MLLHLGGTSWICGHDSVMDSDDQDYMFDERWFHVTCSSNLSHIRCHIGAYFLFGWDLQIFTEVTCSTIDDFMSLIILTCHASDTILGHIFLFRWDLWFFTDVACSMMDDFTSPDLRPIIHSMPYWGLLQFWMRFTDLGGVVHLSPFARRAPRRWYIHYLYDDSSMEPLGSCPVRPTLLNT